MFEGEYSRFLSDPIFFGRCFSFWNLTGHQKMWRSESKPVGGSVCTFTWLSCSNFLKPLQNDALWRFRPKGCYFCPQLEMSWVGIRNFIVGLQVQILLYPIYECVRSIEMPNSNQRSKGEGSFLNFHLGFAKTRSCAGGKVNRIQWWANDNFSMRMTSKGSLEFSFFMKMFIVNFFKNRVFLCKTLPPLCLVFKKWCVRVCVFEWVCLWKSSTL